MRGPAAPIGFSADRVLGARSFSEISQGAWRGYSRGTQGWPKRTLGYRLTQTVMQSARLARCAAGRTHRTVSSLSPDSAAGIVPSSEFPVNDLRGRPSRWVLTWYLLAGVLILAGNCPVPTGTGPLRRVKKGTHGPVRGDARVVEGYVRCTRQVLAERPLEGYRRST